MILLYILFLIAVFLGILHAARIKRLNLENEALRRELDKRK